MLFSKLSDGSLDSKTSMTDSKGKIVHLFIKRKPGEDERKPHVILEIYIMSLK